MPALPSSLGRLLRAAALIAPGLACACSATCPDSPPWLIRDVGLVVTPVGAGARVAGGTAPLTISAPCEDAELTTDFCLGAGEYDLQLVATAYRCLPPAAMGDASCSRLADTRQDGAVVVRWRVLDAQVGQVFGRTQCHCPASLPPPCAAGDAQGAPALTPPAVRRVVKAGQIVNLDAVIIQVNTPPLAPFSDGGALPD